MTRTPAPLRGASPGSIQRDVSNQTRKGSFLVALTLTTVAAALGCSSNSSGPDRTLPACPVEASQGSLVSGADAGAEAGPTTTPREGSLIAAGDIAVCGEDGAERTARLVDGIEGTVAVLGDNAYDHGTVNEYMNCYDASWGRHKWRTRPAVGNHEYASAGAGPYFGYFCGAAGEPSKGYYSYELGSWHVVVLNSNCGDVAGGCAAGSEQHEWLKKDLAEHPTKCTAAYWHHPRFSSGEHGNANDMDTMWRTLYDAGAEVVLTGHDHDYERFAPLDAAGNADEARGMREFVVGTGGHDSRKFGDIKPHSLVRQSGPLGVLHLSLHESSFDWRFLRDDGRATDSGHAECH